MLDLSKLLRRDILASTQPFYHLFADIVLWTPQVSSVFMDFTVKAEIRGSSVGKVQTTSGWPAHFPTPLKSQGG